MEEMKREYCVGEEIPFGLIKLKAEKLDNEHPLGCDGCFVGKSSICDCSEFKEVLGPCSSSERSDGFDVVFVKID